MIIGVHRNTVLYWWMVYEREEITGLKSKKRGFEKGQWRTLDSAQAHEIQVLIVEKTPDQFEVGLCPLDPLGGARVHEHSLCESLCLFVRSESIWSVGDLHRKSPWNARMNAEYPFLWCEVKLTSLSLAPESFFVGCPRRGPPSEGQSTDKRLFQGWLVEEYWGK